jgi:hypothetical protein
MKLVGDKVTGHRGDVLAQKIRGKWETKDPAILAFIEANDKPVKKKSAPKKKVKEVQEIVPAVDAEGNRIEDDPSTPVNESWAVKTVKKVIKKK